MIDLSLYKEQTEEVKLFDSSVIHLKKPTQGLIIEMMAVENQKGKKPLEIIKEVNTVLAKVLSNNTEEKQFTTDYIQDNFDIALATSFIKGYMDFATKIVTQDF